MGTLLRWRYLGIAVVAVVASVCFDRHGPADWSFFVRGSRLLFGSGPGHGLQLYAAHPIYQIGPLSLLLARAMLLDGRLGLASWSFVVLALLLAVVAALHRATTSRPPGASLRRQAVMAAGGMALAAVWCGTAQQWGHLDDLLVLVFVVAAVLAAVRRAPVTAGVLVGLAVVAKPTALVALPLLAAFDSRGRVRAGVASGLVIALGWGPFVLADPATLLAGAPHVRVTATSAWALFTPLGAAVPGWLRPVQLGVALGLGVLVARRGRWYAVPLAGFAVRVALDPGDFSYYAVAVVLAALVVELFDEDRLAPVGTLAAALLLVAWPHLVTARDPQLAAVVAAGRLAVCVALSARAFGVPPLPGRIFARAEPAVGPPQQA